MKNVGHNRWPAQGPELFARVRVMFKDDLTHVFEGRVIRDDMEAPYRTIFQLDDGRVLLDSECVYDFVSLTTETKVS